MHPSVMEFAKNRLTPERVTGKTVLEVGSYDVNGSVRPMVEALEPSWYIGIDIQDGPSVDRVMDIADVTATFDLILCFEMLEHAEDWQGAVHKMKQQVNPRGMILLTTRAPGFPYHPFPEDRWRFTPELLETAFEDMAYIITEDPDPTSPGVFVEAMRVLTPADPDPVLTLTADPAPTR